MSWSGMRCLKCRIRLTWMRVKFLQEEGSSMLCTQCELKATQQKKNTSRTMKEPDIRYSSFDGQLDEVCVEAPKFVHVEVMDAQNIWMGIYLQDDRRVCCNFYLEGDFVKVDQMPDDVEPPVRLRYRAEIEDTKLKPIDTVSAVRESENCFRITSTWGDEQQGTARISTTQAELLALQILNEVQAIRNKNR